MPSTIYYEAHITRRNGTIWGGHTGPTEEAAIQAANEALSHDYQRPPEEEAINISIYFCTRVRTTSLVP